MRPEDPWCSLCFADLRPSLVPESEPAGAPLTGVPTPEPTALDPLTSPLALLVADGVPVPAGASAGTPVTIATGLPTSPADALVSRSSGGKHARRAAAHDVAAANPTSGPASHATSAPAEASGAAPAAPGVTVPCPRCLEPVPLTGMSCPTCGRGLLESTPEETTGLPWLSAAQDPQTRVKVMVGGTLTVTAVCFLLLWVLGLFL